MTIPAGLVQAPLRQGSPEVVTLEVSSSTTADLKREHHVGMRALYERAIDHHNEFSQEDWLVPNSVPILYFGDLEAYRASDLKVVTVGLNPSDREFAVDRFGLETPSALDPSTLEKSLSSYFQKNPYSRWFDPAFETILQPLGSSFYGQEKPDSRHWWRPQSNRALHTDICSPLATSPTWSRLEPGARERLQAVGFQLWRDLITELNPDLVLMSVGRIYRAALGDLIWRPLLPFPEAMPRQQLEITKLGSTKLVWGQASRRPFFYLDRHNRSRAAEAILKSENWI